MACKLGKLIGNTHDLPVTDRALVRGWLDTGRDTHGRTVSAELLSTALTREGHRIGPTTCKDHRGRRCACFREDVDD